MTPNRRHALLDLSHYMFFVFLPQVKRMNDDPIKVDFKVIQPEIPDLMTELKETLETVERLIDEGALNGPQGNVHLVVL